VDIAELEETLARLPSVNAVRVAGGGGEIREVHVLAAPDKAPKQVVRDVQTLALARFGITIDRRVISVVQIGPDRIDLRVWERGVGETLACGTGAVAAVAAAHARGLTGESVTVRLPGGELRVELVDGCAWIEGPARVVYAGAI